MNNIKENYYNLYKEIKKIVPNFSDIEIEKTVENLICTNLINNFDDVINWYEKSKKNIKAKDEIIELNKISD